LASTTFNLDNVALLGSLARRVLSKKLDLNEARGLIKRIHHRTPRYGLIFSYLSYICAAIGICYFFDAGWKEILVATMIATIAYALSMLPFLGQAFPAVATLIGTMLAYLIHQEVWRLQIFTTVISGVIIFGMHLHTHTHTHTHTLTHTHTHTHTLTHTLTLTLTD
jgi:uncharacterized membrane protein YjjP (DUF1212 family)